VSDQIKANLRECSRKLGAECLKLENLTKLVQGAADDSANVLLWRIRFFDALGDRISELSRLRAGFIDSRRAFCEQPKNLLAEGIRDGKQKALAHILVRFSLTAIVDSQRPRS
jgi:hypothetical protein